MIKLLQHRERVEKARRPRVEAERLVVGQPALMGGEPSVQGAINHFGSLAHEAQSRSELFWAELFTRYRRWRADLDCTPVDATSFRQRARRSAEAAEVFDQ